MLRCAEAIIGEVDSAWNVRACLDWIERSELFIIPLDDHREWYRYHHLFQELLQRRLSAEMTADQVNTCTAGLQPGLKSMDCWMKPCSMPWQPATLIWLWRQMSRGLCDVINREDWPTLERWLRLLPEDVIQQQPELLMIRVWLYELTWRLDLQVSVVQQVDELIDSEVSARMQNEDLQILAVKSSC